MGLGTAMLRESFEILVLYFLYIAVVVFICITFCIAVGKKSPSAVVAGISVSIFLAVAPAAYFYFQVQSFSRIEKQRLKNQEPNYFKERCNSEQETIIYEYVPSFYPDVMVINEDADTHVKEYATHFQLAMFFRGSPFQNVYEKRFIKDLSSEECNSESTNAEICSDNTFGYDYYHHLTRTLEQPVGSLTPPTSDMLLLRISPAVPSGDNHYEIADVFIEQNGRVIAKANIYRSGPGDYCPSPEVVIRRMFADLSSHK